MANLTVPFLDLRAAYQEVQAEVEPAVLASLRKGWYILGPELESFEVEFAAYHDVACCIGISNGLDALYLALCAMDIGVGDEVIVPTNTFIATWLAVSRCGATIVPVEPDPTTFNMDPVQIEPAITEKTRVIIPVHLYGQPVDLTPILDIARKHDLMVLEDAAQSHGAYYKNKPIGGHGDAVAWSFYPGKNLGAFGDGGAITTNNSELASRITTLRNYGSHEKYINKLQGFNCRLDPVQAVALGIKLKYLKDWNKRRQTLAIRYSDKLAESDLILPVVSPWAKPVWHLYVVRTPVRDALQSYLSDRGIETLVHYPVPPHMQQAYTDLGFKRGDFAIAEEMADEVLSLPIGPHLTHDQQDHVIGTILEFNH